MKVLVRAPLHPYTGYGSDGIGIVKALLSMGVDVYAQPNHVSPPLPRDVAEVLTKRLDPPFDLILEHVDPLQIDIPPEVRSAGEFVVGWTMWEWTSFENLKNPDPSARKALQTWERRLSNLDAIACYSDVTMQALNTVAEFVPKFIAQGGYWAEDWLFEERDWYSDRFGFCMVGALHDRKDPFAAVQAWQELKAEYPEFEPAEIHFKTVVPGLHSAMEQCYDKLRVHYDIWPQDVLRQFYAAQHCLISTSRGEGKNMPCLEFMSTGGAVIATNWGGHKQWLNSEYSYPLRCTEQPEVNFPTCVSARSDKEHLKELMMHVFRNRFDARQKGEIASQVIPKMCSWQATIERMLRGFARTEPRAYKLVDQLMSAKAPKQMALR